MHSPKKNFREDNPLLQASLRCLILLNQMLLPKRYFFVVIVILSVIVIYREVKMLHTDPICCVVAFHLFLIIRDLMICLLLLFYFEFLSSILCLFWDLSRSVISSCHVFDSKQVVWFSSCLSMCLPLQSCHIAQFYLVADFCACVALTDVKESDSAFLYGLICLFFTFLFPSASLYILLLGSGLGYITSRARTFFCSWRIFLSWLNSRHLLSWVISFMFSSMCCLYRCTVLVAIYVYIL
jgi:hypothetical protein